MTVLIAGSSWPSAQVAPSTPPASPPAAAGAAHPELDDTEATTCATCHEDIAKAKVVHGPVAEGMCTGCHEFSGTGDATRVALVEGAAKDNVAPLCITCHDDVGTRVKAAQAHVPAASGDCLGCHLPHGADHAKLLTAPQAELCVTCHDAIGESLAKAFPHAPAAQACAMCHDPHGDANPRMLRRGLNDLCMQCHQQPAAPATPAPGAIATPDSVALAIAELGKGAAKLVLRGAGSRGHPTGNHPVSGPTSIVDKAQPLTCASCHDPHGAGVKTLLRFGATTGTELCLKCHEF